MASSIGKIIIGGGAVVLGYKIGNSSIDYFTQTLKYTKKSINERLRLKPGGQLLTREATITSLKSEVLDVLVVGGSFKASIAALDAASRGLKTGLVDSEDFNSNQESSLIEPDNVGSLGRVKERLTNKDMEWMERLRFDKADDRWHQFQIAPHLATPNSFLLFIGDWMNLFMFYVGNKLSDLLVNKPPKFSSSLVTQTKVIQRVPWASPFKFVGGIEVVEILADMNRLILSTVITAARWGALPLNHCTVVHINREEGKEFITVGLEDKLENVCYEVKTKVLLTAVVEDKQEHFTTFSVPNCLLGKNNTGVYIPNSDLLVQLNSQCDCSTLCIQKTESVRTAFETLKSVVSENFILRKGDILTMKDSSYTKFLNWEILTPNTQTMVDKDRTIIDELVKSVGLETLRATQMSSLLIEGAHGWHPNLYLNIMSLYGLSEKEASHLVHRYGDQAAAVAKTINNNTSILEAEVRHAVECELAQSLVSLVKRLNLEKEMISLTANIMGSLLNWDHSKQDKQTFLAEEYCTTLQVASEWKTINLNTGNDDTNFTETQENMFKSYAAEHNYLQHAQLETIIRKHNPVISSDFLERAVREEDLERNGFYSKEEFLRLMSKLWAKSPEEVAEEHIKDIIDTTD